MGNGKSPGKPGLLKEVGSLLQVIEVFLTSEKGVGTKKLLKRSSVPNAYRIKVGLQVFRLIKGPELFNVFTLYIAISLNIKMG